MKKLIYEHIAVVLVIVLCAFSYSIIIATAGLLGGFDGDPEGAGGPTAGDGGKDGASIYYFNNAVDTSPDEVGNYWYDADATDPAQEVPDSTQVELHVLNKATYDGNATFISNGSNDGTVNGNATFVGDDAENTGEITGLRTRLYNSGTTDTATKDFTDNPWTVKADGITLDVTHANYDLSTTFVRVNGGLFASNMVATSASVNGNTLIIEYNTNLDTNLVDAPITSDFPVSVNGSEVGVTHISIGDTNITLTLASSVAAGSTTTVSYTLGSGNFILSANGLNAPVFEDLNVSVETPVQNNNNNNNNQDNNQNSNITPAPVQAGPSLPISFLTQQSRTVKSLSNSKVVSEKEAMTKNSATADVATDSVKKDEAVSEKTAEKTTEVSTSGSSATVQAEVKATETPEAKATVEKLKSKTLLAVEDKGTVWYVAPSQGQRYEVSKDNALNIFRSTSLGITNKDLDRIPVAGTTASSSALGSRLVGRFLLQVEGRGETWYVSPSGQRIRVTPENIVEVTKQSAIGITNNNLVKIPTTK